jgi:sec-independent protein translocase protein TatC
VAVTDERPDPSSGAFDHEEPTMKPPEDKATGTMTLFEHLAELRVRILIVVLAVAAGTLIAWFFYDSAISFMLRPYHEFLLHHKAKDISHGNLVTNGPLEGFTTRLKVSVYGGIALASPIIFWELWRFITPGLYKNEKRYILPFVGAAVFLFSAGVATAILIFPKALTWLIDVSGTGVVPLFSPSRYFTLYVAMCLVFGLVFCYPLVVVFLQLAGVVPSLTWRRWRRPSIVVLAAVAAVITPSSDPFSFLALWVPMVVLYEASIIVGRLMKK